MVYELLLYHIAKRLAHIGVLHWRVWERLVYLSMGININVVAVTDVTPAM
jgi:hypothetical protein